MPYLVILSTAILLMTSSHGSGAFEYPNDLARWAVTRAPDPWKETEAPELGDARFNAAQADADHHWFVYLRAGRPSAPQAHEPQ